MNSTLNYLIEVNVGLTFFMIIYWMTLRNENQFLLKRAYLLLAMASSFIFPLFHFTGNTSAQTIPSISTIIPSYWLPEIVVNGNGNQQAQLVNNNVSFWEVAETFYLLIVGLLILVFVFRLIKIVHLFYSSQIYRWQNCWVAESSEEKSTFSFFSYIFIGQANQLNESEKEKILTHEQAHAQQLHSFDIVFTNLVSIICWFNPIIPIYKKTLVQLHEFEADARSVANSDVDQYCGLLAKVALQSVHIPIANHFNNSLTLKRIEMMKTMKHKINQWKVTALLAVVPVFFYLVACQDQLTTMKEISQNSSVALDIPKDVQAQFDKLKRENPKNSYSVLETYNKGQDELLELAKKGHNLDEYAGFQVMNSGSRTFVIVTKTDESLKFAEATKSGDVYTFVEEMATPKIGMDAYLKYVRGNLKYPQRAKDSKIEGKVFVKFIISLDGSISDLIIAKGLDDECDKEAMRVIKEGPEWNPGKQDGKAVKTVMILPFNFQLGDQPINKQSKGLEDGK